MNRDALNHKTPWRVAARRWYLVPGLPLVLYFALPLGTLLNRPVAVAQAVLDRQVRHSLLLTFACAGGATLVGIFFAVPLGYAIARRRLLLARVWMALVDMPLILPHPVAGIALLLLLGRDGWVGGLAAHLRLTFVDNPAGIAAAMLFVSCPFLVHSCRDGFRAVDPRFEQVAQSLGCSGWQAFRRVSLPLAWPQILSGAILTFARAVAEFGSLVILTYNPRVISILIYDRFSTYGVSYALPVAGLLVVFGFLIIWGVSTLEGVPE